MSVLGKGGASKTTSTACLGDALERLTGWGTVLVDLDSQPSLTEHLNDGPTRATLVEVLRGQVPLDDVVVELRPGPGGGLRLLPAHDGLVDLEPEQLASARVGEVLSVLDRAAPAGVALIDTPAWQPMTSSSTLLLTATDLADVVVVPFNLGRKGVRAMIGAVLDVQSVRQGRVPPVVLLPANVDSPAEVEGAVELARWLRPDLVFAGPVQHVPAMRRAEDRGRLLADDAPRSPAVGQYAAAAEVLARTLEQLVAGGGVR